MSSSSVLSIPEDIINCIVEELVNDKHALSRCSLAARVFCDPCQRHLFSHIYLDNVSTDENEQLLNTLIISPRVQFHIRHLHLQLHSLYGTVRQESVLPGILLMLPQLRSFSLSHGITSGLLHYGSISDDLKSSIFTLLQSPRLESVALAHLQEFPIYFLSRCPQLQTLTLADVNPFHIDMWFEPNPELVPPRAVGRTRALGGGKGLGLRQLVLQMEPNPSWSFVHPETFHHVRESIDLAGLTSIIIGSLSVDEEVEEYRKIIESTELLEELSITLDFSLASRPPKPLSFDLPSRDKLRALSITIHNGPHHTTPPELRWHTLSWLHDALSPPTLSRLSTPGPPPLSVETFTLRLADQAVMDLDRADDHKYWRGIDSALAGGRFACLRKVVVVFETQRELPGDVGLFLEGRVAGLVDRRLVEVFWGMGSSRNKIYPV